MPKDIQHVLVNFLKLVGPILIFSLIFSFLTFLAERNVNEAFVGENFLWWWITTISTVGYGDIVPVTSLGKWLASMVVFSSILFVAVGISQINNLILVLAKRHEKGLRLVRDKSHILIINSSRIMAKLAEIIAEIFPDKKIFLLSNQEEKFIDNQISFVHGDPTNHKDLIRANVSDAFMCIILPKGELEHSDYYSLIIATEIEKINSNVITIVDILEKENQSLFRSSNIDIVLSDKNLQQSVVQNSEKFVAILQKYAL